MHSEQEKKNYNCADEDVDFMKGKENVTSSIDHDIIIIRDNISVVRKSGQRNMLTCIYSGL